MSEELKPCPFCGSSAVALEYQGLNWMVECSNSEHTCGVLPISECFNSRAEAESAWNRRAPDPVCDALAAAVRAAQNAVNAFWPSDPPLNEIEAGEDATIARLRKRMKEALALYDSWETAIR